jgi:peptide/nickel transport system substrate-binding protein
MKKKWEKLLIGVGMLVLTVGLTFHSGAAAPTGEIKIACPTLGTEVPIHYRGGATDWDWMKMLYDPLIGTTPDSQESTEHGLARKWEMTPDGLTWTFYLRKGVKFHNGEEVTAKDVKFSLALAVRPDSMLGYAGQFKSTIASVDIKDPYTIVIRCKKPYPYLANLLADVGGPDSSILPKDYFEKVGPDEFAKRPIGSGPYKWHSQMIGSFIKLEATEKHWRDGVPKYKYLTFLLIPEEISRLSMLKTGEAVITFISRENVAGALKAGLNIVS